MFLDKQKFISRIKELNGYRYRDCVPIESFYVAEDTGEVGSYPPKSYDHKSIFSIGDHWRGRDNFLWLHTIVESHMPYNDKQVVGLFSFHRTNQGRGTGFESLLFVNSKPYQGVDTNHTEVLFDEKTSAQSIQLDFRLWSGLEGGGKPQEQEYKLEVAQIGWLDEKVDHLYYTLLALYETLMEINESTSEFFMLKEILSNVLAMIDWTNPGSEMFYESCYQAETLLTKSIDKVDKATDITIYTVGHTHIDVAYLWRLKHTREKSARSFSTVLQLMQRFPDYLFIQSQPQLYEYMKEDYPEIYAQIKKSIIRTQWEPGGAMWLEADCNIPSGESLVRQILYGKEFLKKEFGIDCDYLWLPDVFGYSWALPQILKKSGIKTMMTTKISWNQYNRMPHDTFFWKGIDGSEVLTHFITTPDLNGKTDSFRYTYNGEITAKTIQGLWEGYRDKEISKDLLLAYGYGDGGGGVNRHMLEMKRRFNQLPGMPNVRSSTAKEFFDQLHENIKNTDGYIHKWDGELYLEYHRGTYTSQAVIKKENRQLEVLYRKMEFLSTWLSPTGSWVGQDRLQLGWKIILRNQFHDIIPRSITTEVLKDTKLEYEEAFEIINEIEGDILSNEILTAENALTLVNATHIKGKRNVQLPEINHKNDKGIWRNQDGKVLKAQKNSNGWLVEIDSLPSFGMTSLYFNQSVEDNKEDSCFDYKDRCLDTPFYNVKWNEFGQISFIYDKEAKRNILLENQTGNVFQIFEDKPLQYDAWDIDIYYQEKMEEIRDLLQFKIVQNGALSFTIQMKWKYHRSEITQNILFYANDRRIDFQTNINWYERQKLLKVAFPIDVRTTEATYDIQYGNVRRPTHWNTSWDMARFESVGHQWADLSEANYGVSLLNDSKYGYDIKESIMRLTLLKSAIYPDPIADQGSHVFTYSLYPHLGDWRQANTVEKAWELNDPILTVQGEIKKTTSFLNVDANHIWIDAIKPAEDGEGFIIRVHEYEGRRGNINLDLHYEKINWIETDLMEKPIGTKKSSLPITFSITPYEIKTFRVNVK